MKVKIRQAKLEDLSRIVFITNLAYKAPYKTGAPITKPHQTKDIKEKFLKKEFSALVAIADGKIVGAIKYKKLDKNSLYGYQTATLKTYRNKSIGSLLVNKLEKIAKQKGYKKVVGDCLKEKYLPEYYEKLGYKPFKIKEEKGFNKVFMSKKIL